jgi:Rrf2 family protein
MLLNKNTDYAVRALLEAAKSPKGKFLSSAEISKVQNIPLRFLRKILTGLISAKYLKSKEGAGGGVVLNKKPKNIKLSDIIGLFQHKIEFSRCMFRKKLCRNRQTCPLRKRILKIEKKAITDFENITIQTLLKDTKNKRR